MEANQTVKKGIYFLAIVLLLMPFIQQKLKLFELKKLNGYFTSTPSIILKYKTWNSGVFQNNLEKKSKEKVGFHDFFIRLNNQRRYSLFDSYDVFGVIEGKQNMLFYDSYIETYFGNDFIGIPKVETFSHKMKFIQDSLKKRGKLFFFLIVPGKTAIYPELIPDRFYESNTKKITNHEAMVQEFKKIGFNFLDLNRYIQSNKEEFKYPIFPKYGVHWTGNTVANITDTLLRFMEHNSEFKLIDVELSLGEKTILNYRFTDYDIGESLNLFSHLAEDTLYYPTMNYSCDSCVKPRILGVGDSFIQSFRGFYHTYDSAFAADSYIWYYNETIDWPEKFNGKGVSVKSLSLEKEIDKAGIILLESTDENLKNTGFKFVDELYDLLKNGKPVYSEAEQQKIKEFAEKQSTLDEAEKLYEMIGYNKEEMIEVLAIQKFKKTNSQGFNYDEEVQKIIFNIKNDPEWLKKVEHQAKERGISVEENILKNAKWVVDQY